MKKYKLKEEVKKYLSWGGELTAEQWKEKGVELEALEEVKEVLTYEDLARELFVGKKFYHLDDNGKTRTFENDPRFEVPNNALTSYQLECLMASNMLTNVANYLNEGCEFVDGDQLYCISIFHEVLAVGRMTYLKDGKTYFKTKILAQQALEILGEETTIKALTKNF